MLSRSLDIGLFKRTLQLLGETVFPRTAHPSNLPPIFITFSPFLGVKSYRRGAVPDRPGLNVNGFKQAKRDYSP
jgi:hypothetical protein